MQQKSNKGEFDDSDRVKRSFPEFLPRYEMQDIMCIGKLKNAMEFLNRNRNGTRNKALLLFFLHMEWNAGKCVL